MRLLALVLLAGAVAAAPADDYFEVGLDYLKKGFFARARRAFSESLVRAPGQPVPTIFAGVAAAAEGLDAGIPARLLRRGVLALPHGHGVALDLRDRLPSARALALLKRDYARKLARGVEDRGVVLAVLAFLEVFDGDAATAAALDALRKESPKDAYAGRLAAIRPEGAAASSRSTTSPTSSAPSGARGASSSGRS